MLALINFFLISTPKCIELNSEFVGPKKNLGFGFVFGSKTQTKVFFGLISAGNYMENSEIQIFLRGKKMNKSVFDNFILYERKYL